MKIGKCPMCGSVCELRQWNESDGHKTHEMYRIDCKDCSYTTFSWSEDNVVRLTHVYNCYWVKKAKTLDIKPMTITIEVDQNGARIK